MSDKTVTHGRLFARILTGCAFAQVIVSSIFAPPAPPFWAGVALGAVGASAAAYFAILALWWKAWPRDKAVSPWVWILFIAMEVIAVACGLFFYFRQVGR